MEKNYPKIDLDTAARLFANGHFVVQTMPGPNPELDKKVTEEIAKIKAERSAAKARP